MLGADKKQHIAVFNMLIDTVSHFSTMYMQTYLPEEHKAEALDSFADQCVRVLESYSPKFKVKCENVLNRLGYVSAARDLFEESIGKPKWWSADLNPDTCLHVLMQRF